MAEVEKVLKRERSKGKRREAKNYDKAATAKHL
jgi:hypothetical protein